MWKDPEALRQVFDAIMDSYRRIHQATMHRPSAWTATVEAQRR
jgi:hypothetical protein